MILRSSFYGFKIHFEQFPDPIHFLTETQFQVRMYVCTVHGKILVPAKLVIKRFSCIHVCTCVHTWMDMEA